MKLGGPEETSKRFAWNLRHTLVILGTDVMKNESN